MSRCSGCNCFNHLSNAQILTKKEYELSWLTFPQILIEYHVCYWCSCWNLGLFLNACIVSSQLQHAWYNIGKSSFYRMQKESVRQTFERFIIKGFFSSKVKDQCTYLVNFEGKSQNKFHQRVQSKSNWHLTKFMWHHFYGNSRSWEN